MNGVVSSIFPAPFSKNLFLMKAVSISFPQSSHFMKSEV